MIAITETDIFDELCWEHGFQQAKFVYNKIMMVKGIQLNILPNVLLKGQSYVIKYIGYVLWNKMITSWTLYLKNEGNCGLFSIHKTHEPRGYLTRSGSPW